jgi:hypothetical protein
VFSTVLTNVGIDIIYGNDNNITIKNFIQTDSVCIYNIYNNEILNVLDAYIQHAMYRLENKIKIFRRSEKEIFRSSMPLERPIVKKEIHLKRKTNLYNIFTNFLTTAISRRKSIQEVDLLKNSKTKIFNHIQKYTNEFVENVEQKLKNKDKKIKCPTVKSTRDETSIGSSLNPIKSNLNSYLISFLC